MGATYTLGRDYTVDGLTAATDLTVSHSGERIDISTRAGAKPFKATVAGFPDLTFSCSAYAEDDTVFTIGKAYSITLNGGSAMSLICMSADRDETGDGIVTYKLTFKPGMESETANQVDIGPGTYRS